MLKFSHHNGTSNGFPNTGRNLSIMTTLKLDKATMPRSEAFTTITYCANNASELNTFTKHHAVSAGTNLCREIPNHSKTNLPEIQTQRSLYSRVYGKNGKAKERRLYNEGLKRKESSYDRSIDRCPNPMPGVSTTFLTDRLKSSEMSCAVLRTICCATSCAETRRTEKARENWEN